MQRVRQLYIEGQILIEPGASDPTKPHDSAGNNSYIAQSLTFCQETPPFQVGDRMVSLWGPGVGKQVKGVHASIVRVCHATLDPCLILFYLKIIINLVLILCFIATSCMPVIEVTVDVKTPFNLFFHRTQDRLRAEYPDSSLHMSFACFDIEEWRKARRLQEKKDYDQASLLKNSLLRKVLRLCRAFPGPRILVESGDDRRVEIEFATTANMLVDCVRTGRKD